MNPILSLSRESPLTGLNRDDAAKLKGSREVDSCVVDLFGLLHLAAARLSGGRAKETPDRTSAVDDIYSA